MLKYECPGFNLGRSVLQVLLGQSLRLKVEEKGQTFMALKTMNMVARTTAVQLAVEIFWGSREASLNESFF